MNRWHMPLAWWLRPEVPDITCTITISTWPDSCRNLSIFCLFVHLFTCHCASTDCRTVRFIDETALLDLFAQNQFVNHVVSYDRSGYKSKLTTCMSGWRPYFAPWSKHNSLELYMWIVFFTSSRTSIRLPPHPTPHPPSQRLPQLGQCGSASPSAWVHRQSRAHARIDRQWNSRIYIHIPTTVDVGSGGGYEERGGGQEKYRLVEIWQKFELPPTWLHTVSQSCGKVNALTCELVCVANRTFIARSHSTTRSFISSNSVHMSSFGQRFT